VTGVRTPELEVRAQLVVGADGRKSAARAAAGLETASSHSPINVLWFRMKWHPGDPQELFRGNPEGLAIGHDLPG
jgi:2-polyprenyl-6-methoxyphenol hydroxylase-like FAD-dependent oxidoreductase